MQSPDGEHPSLTAADAARLTEAIRASIETVIVGQADLVRAALVCLLTEGHALVEGVPGLGKTELVKALGRSSGLEFKRIQFTADLMPADVTGTSVIDESVNGARSFAFRPGPVFANIVLADEINRATPKTQGALLEAMAERTVTIGGETRPLPRPFFVMATQNPIEMEGTYPLPEAQLDRFLVKAHVPYPTDAELRSIIDRTTGAEPAVPPAAATLAELRSLIATTRTVPVTDHALNHAVALVRATQPAAPGAPTLVREAVRYGSSPRGAQGLVLVAKALALLDGRPSASTADVRAAAPLVLAHRCVLSYAAMARGVDEREVIEAVLATVDVPDPLPRGVGGR